MQYELSYYIGKYRKLVFGIIVALVILLSGLVVYIQWQQAALRQGKFAVPVELVPRDATVRLDNERITNRGSAWVTPGDHTVIVSREGFESYKGSVRVSADSTPFIYVALTGKSDDAKKWQENNRHEYTRLELLTIKKSREYNTRFKSNNPIVTILPIKDPYYTIDYRNHDDKSVELTIYGTAPRYRQAALDFLRKKGYEPTDYRVSYEGFTNPLGGTRE